MERSGIVNTLIIYGLLIRLYVITRILSKYRCYPFIMQKYEHKPPLNLNKIYFKEQ